VNAAPKPIFCQKASRRLRVLVGEREVQDALEDLVDAALLHLAGLVLLAHLVEHVEVLGGLHVLGDESVELFLHRAV